MTRLKWLAGLLFTVLCALSTASAQYTVVSASHAPCTNATVYWQAIIPARIGSTSGQVSGLPVSASCTSGTFGVSVADGSLSSPATCYAVTIVDNTTGATLLGQGLTSDGHVSPGGAYGCVQPAGGGWNFDSYSPPATGVIVNINGNAVFNWQGAWSGSSTYHVGDAVSYSGASYYNTLANNTNTPPGSGWSLLAAPGANGTNCASGSSPGVCNFNGQLVATNLTGTIDASSGLATTIGPRVFDHFNYADGTHINGQLAESGNATWAVSGTGASDLQVLDTHTFLPSSDYGGTTTTYASLANTSTNGGTAQPITTIGGTFRLCQNGDGQPFNNNYSVLFLLATQAQLNLSNMLHLQISATGWSLQKVVAGGSFVAVNGGPSGGNFTSALVSDCATEYSAAMKINSSLGTVALYLPDGEVITGYSDSDITAIAAKYGLWEQSADPSGIPGAPLPEWGYVWMGGPIQTAKSGASGGMAPATLTGNLYGFGVNHRVVYPAFTIPSSAAAGYYRIATFASFGGFQLHGTFSVSTTQTDALVQGFTIFADGTSSQIVKLVQTDAASNSLQVFDKCVLSNDGSANVALDCHYADSYSGQTVTVNVDGTGIFTPVINPTAGVTPYTNASQTVNLVNTPPVTSLNQTMTGGSGWHVMMTWGGTIFAINTRGTFSFFDGSSEELLDLAVTGSTSGCDVTVMHATTVYPVSQLRCSWSGSSVQLEVNQSTSSTMTVSSTNVQGWYSFPANSAAGSSPLGSGNTVLMLFTGGSASMTPFLPPPAVANIVAGLPGCGTANSYGLAKEFEWRSVTDATAESGVASGGGSLHRVVLCLNSQWLVNGHA